MSTLKYIKPLDGLRSIAIILVLLWHFIACQVSGDLFGGKADKMNTLLSWTWSGVDLFFVLSGFLIGRILLHNRSSKNFFKAFYLRRVFRIFPPYYLVLIGLFVYQMVSNSSEWLTAGLHPYYSYILYIQNFSMAFDGGYGGNWLSVTWSLAIEEQFYLIFPLMVYFISPKKIVRIAVMGILLAPIFRAISGPILDSWLGSYVLLPMRMDALLIGVVIAHLYLNGKLQEYFSKEKNLLLYMAGILLIAIVTLVVFGEMEKTGGVYNHSLLGIFYGLILIYVLVAGDNKINQFLSIKIFSFLAKISYMVYLTHQIFTGLLHEIFADQRPQINNSKDAMITVASLVLTIAFSALSYYLFESPLMKLGRKYKY